MVLPYYFTVVASSIVYVFLLFGCLSPLLKQSFSTLWLFLSLAQDCFPKCAIHLTHLNVTLQGPGLDYHHCAMLVVFKLMTVSRLLGTSLSTQMMEKYDFKLTYIAPIFHDAQFLHTFVTRVRVRVQINLYITYHSCLGTPLLFYCSS